MLGAVGPALQRATLALAPHAACSRLLAVRPTQVFDLRSAHQRFIPRTFRWGLDGKALRAPILFFKPPSLPTVAAPCIKDPTTRLLTDGLKASLESGALNVTVESNGRVELVACWQGSHRGLQPPNGSRLSCGPRPRGRKEVERQTKRLASEATQFFPTCERPPASSAC